MMMTSDPIADMLTRIRNANTAKHDTVDFLQIRELSQTKKQENSRLVEKY